MPMPVVIRLDQVNTVGVFQPNSVTVGHEFIMYTVWHTSAIGYTTVGQAPVGPGFTEYFFYSGIQFVVVVHSSIYLSTRRMRHQIPNLDAAKLHDCVLYGTR